MENSIEKIKKEIETKRKNNEEFIKLLKEKSILYNAQKEKQKKYFYPNNFSFLNKKRKFYKNDDNNHNNDNEMSNDLDNYIDNDYIEDFMTSSFISTRTFSNLNFCRPERFSFRKKKKKLSIKNQGGFTIYKSSKPIQKLESSKITITLTSNEKDSNINNYKLNSKLGLFSDIEGKNKSLETENSDLFDIKDSKKENEKKSGLFMANSPLKLDNNNSKSLFTSNISQTKKIEIKAETKNENKNENKSNESLFGNLNRADIKGESKLFFGTSNIKKEEKINISENPKEKEPKKEPLFGFSTINNKEEKNPSLFNLVEKKEENKMEDAAKTSSENKISLFGEGFELKEKKSEEKKEKISLFGNTEKEEKKDEIIKDNTLFGSPTKNEEKNEKPTIIFNNGNLFGNQVKKEEIKINDIKDDISPKKTGLFNINEKTDNNNNESSKPLFELKPKDEEKNKNDNIILNNNNNNEGAKINNILNSKGSLANDVNNPFLQPGKLNNISNVFSAANLSNNANNRNNPFSSQNNNIQHLSNFNNTNIYNNNEKRNIFEASATGGMDMSPQIKPRTLFITDNSSSNNLINLNDSNSKTNIFGAPTSNNINNSSSLFSGNNNHLFRNSGSNNLFGNQQQNISLNSGFPSGMKAVFNLGKKN